MKKLSLLLIGLLLIPALFLTSCDSGDDPGTTPVATPAFTLMKEYMVQVRPQNNLAMRSGQNHQLGRNTRLNPSPAKQNWN